MPQQKPRVLLIGRHAPDGLEDIVEVVEQRPVLFSTDHEEALKQLRQLAEAAYDMGLDGLLLQNIPAPLGAGLLDVLDQAIAWQGYPFGPKWNLWPQSDFCIGVVISKPGPRPVGVAQQASFSSPEEAKKAADLVRTANPRAKVNVKDNSIYIVVDPPMRFQLDRVVWVGCGK